MVGGFVECRAVVLVFCFAVSGPAINRTHVTVKYVSSSKDVNWNQMSDGKW